MCNKTALRRPTTLLGRKRCAGQMSHRLTLSKCQMEPMPECAGPRVLFLAARAFQAVLGIALLLASAPTHPTIINEYQERPSEPEDDLSQSSDFLGELNNKFNSSRFLLLTPLLTQSTPNKSLQGHRGSHRGLRRLLGSLLRSVRFVRLKWFSTCHNTPKEIKHLLTKRPQRRD